MHRLIQACLVLMVVSCAIPVARQARAEMAPGEHRDGGLGFHRVEAPVGVRWWTAGQKVGFDFGFGYDADPDPVYTEENVNAWSIDFGVPFVIHSWERVHVIFRPGILYTSQQVRTTTPPAEFDTDNETTLNVAAEIEGELFLANNFSVSASHGIQYESVNPSGAGETRSSFGTFGRNFTNVGFHIYFFGGSH